MLLEQKQKEFSEKNLSDLKTENKEAKKWTEFLTDKRLKSKINEIGIFYHKFSGELQKERIEIENEKTILAKNIDVDFLRNINENELIWTKL